MAYRDAISWLRSEQEIVEDIVNRHDGEVFCSVGLFVGLHVMVSNYARIAFFDRSEEGIARPRRRHRRLCHTVRLR